MWHNTCGRRFISFSKLRGHLILTLWLALASVMLLSRSASAASGSWTNYAGNANWSGTTNWSGGTMADGNAATGWFTNNITGNRTITIDTTSRSLGIMNIGDADTSHAFTIAASGTAKLTFTNSGANAQLNQVTSGNSNIITAPIIIADSLDIANASTNGLMISGTLTNGASVVKTVANVGGGSGVVTLGGTVATNVLIVQNSANSILSLSVANNTTNGVWIKSGTVKLGNAGAAGPASSVITIGDNTGGANAAVLNTTAQVTYLAPIVVMSNNTGAATISSTSLASDFSGTVTLLSHSLTLSATGRLTPGSGVTGTGNLTFNTTGAGYVTITPQPVNMVGTITNAGSGSTDCVLCGLGSNVTAVVHSNVNSGLTISTTNLTVNSGGTTLANINPSGTTLLSVSTAIRGTGNLILNNNSSISNGVTLSAAVTNIGQVINSGTGTGNTLISGVIGTNVSSVIQNSANSMLILGGANTYTGGTTITSGKLVTTNSNGTGSGPVTINNGGTLSALGSIPGGVTINSGGKLQGSAALSGPTQVNAGGLVQGTVSMWGVVTNALGGTLAPGSDASTGATLTMSNLVWNGGGVFRCKIASIANNEAGAGVDYDRLVVANTLTSVPAGSNLVIRMDSLGQTLSFDPAQNYSLKVVSANTTVLNTSDISLDTNDFKVAGAWYVTNLNNAIYVVYRGESTKNYWLGTGTATNWSSAANWSKGHVPQPGEDIEFDFRGYASCTASNASNNLGSITLAAGYTGNVTFAANGIAGGMSMTVPAVSIYGGNLVFAGDTTAQGDGSPSVPWGVGYTLTISNLLIAAAGSLNADNQGFAPGTGPGKSSLNQWGASYGGRGGCRYTTNAFLVPACYGNVAAPTALGSGGSASNPGGGALKLVLSGLATIHGRLSASAVYVAGNQTIGSGGSVWITGGTLAGTGVIAANGGTVSGAVPSNTQGGGGGGRIDLSGTTNNFVGLFQVLGGLSSSSGAAGLAGSILLPQTTGTGLTMDNFVLTNAITFGNSLTFTQPVVVTNGGSLTLHANSNNTVYTFTSLTVATNSSVTCQGNTAIINESAGGVSTNPYGVGVTLAASSVTIDAGGSLNANANGFYASGPGGSATSKAGGAYGGRSTNLLHATYGALSNVTALGSGGSAAFGGGSMKLVVSGTLTVNGTNACDGGRAVVNQAGGSGGSLWIDCGTLQGAGVITASGGPGYQGPGGGGGRIYLAYDGLGPVNPVASGKVTAYGGTGNGGVSDKGGAGTVLLLDRGAGQQYGALIIDQDLNATNSTTPFPTNTDCFAGTPPSVKVDQVHIRGYGVLELPQDRTLAVVSVFSNGASILVRSNSTVALVGTNDAVVYGSNVFENLSITSAVKTVRFNAGSTNLVSRGLYVTNATLLSTTPGQYWYLTLGASSTQDVRRVQAQDSHAGLGLAVTVQGARSTDLGHNVNWTFPLATLPDIDVVAATNVADTTADLIANLYATGAPPITVWAFWDTTDRGTNKTWVHSTSFTPTTLGWITNSISGLPPNQTNFFTYYISNSVGEAWASTSLPFRTWGQPSFDNGAGATDMSFSNVTLRGTLLNGRFAYTMAAWGTSPATLTSTSAPVWMAEGPYSVAVTGLLPNTTYYYQCGGSNAYGMNWAPTVTNFNTLAIPAAGANGSWISDAAGNWSEAPNWDAGTVADGTARTAWFTNNITGDRTVTLDDTSRSLGVLNVGDADTTHCFTLAASGGASLTFTNNGTAQLNQTVTSKGDTVALPIILGDSLDIANASANPLTISGAITNLAVTARTLSNTGPGNVAIGAPIGNGAGSLGLNQNNSASVLSLNGTNSFSGSVTVSAGAVSIQSDTALGSTSGATTVNAGGALRLQGGITVGAEPLALNGNGVAADGALRNLQGTNTYGGQITLGSAALIQSDTGKLILDVASGSAVTGAAQTATFGGAGDIQVADPIGAAAVAKNGAGTLILTAANTYTGLTTVANGVLNIRDGAALGATSAGTVISNGAALQVQDGLVSAEPLTLVGSGIASDGALRSLTGANTNSGAITLGGAARINTDNGTLVLSGSIGGAGQNLTLGCATTTTVAGAIATGGGSVTKDGAGWLILTGTNTFTGGLTLKAGILSGLVTSNAFGASTSVITLGDGAGVQDTTLIAGFAGTFPQPISVAAGNTGIATLTNTVACTFSNLVTLNSHDLRMASSASLLTLSGGTAGSGQLALLPGAGGLTLATASINHTGQVVNTGSGAGTVTISAAIGANVTGVVQQNANALLILSGASSMTNGLWVKAGTVSGITSANAFGANTNLILLGDNAGNASVTLNAGYAGTFAQPIAINSNFTGVALITNSANVTLSGPVTLYTHDLTLAPAASTLTLGGGILGTGTLTLATSGAGTITLSGAPANAAGTILNSGTGSGLTTLSGGIGSNVTAVIENSTASALTLSTTALTVNAGGTTLANLNTGGSAILTVSGGVNGTGNLILSNNSAIAAGITLATTSVNPTGQVIHASTGSGGVTISAVIGSNVTAVIQQSTNGILTLSGANTFTNGLLIKAGTVKGGNAASFGAPTSVVTLGDTTGSLDATLFTTASTTYANPITVASNNTGVVTLTDSSASTFSGAVTLCNHALVLSAPTARITLNGGITGTGNLLIDNAGAGYINLSGSAVNMIGAITNTGSGTTETAISGGIGSNVTTITENSTACPLTISSVKLTVNSGGTTLANNNAGGSALLTVSGGVQGTGSLSLNNNSSIMGGITLSGTSINHEGSLTNAGSGTGDVIVSAVIGPNVTAVVQASTTSRLVLSGANTYGGPTLVAAGATLRVTNATGSATGTGAVTLNGTLQGSGTLSGTVTNMLNGTLAPGYDGSTVGTMTVGNLVWSGGGIYRCRILSLANNAAGAGTDYDQIIVSSALTSLPAGSNLVLRLDSLGQTLTFDTNLNYSLKLLSYGSTPGFNVSDVSLDTNAFLCGGTWALTNLNSALYLVCYASGAASRNYWIGSGSSTNWSTAANWSLGHVPQPGEDVEFDFRALANCNANAVSNNLNSLTLAGSYTGTVTFATNAVDGAMTLAAGTITVGAGNLVFCGDTTAQGDGTPSVKWGIGYTLQVSNLAIAVGASINSDNQGFAPGAGPGRPSSSTWGPSYGGRGGCRFSTNAFLVPASYGTVAGPTALGSGGNASNPGGGALKVVVAGTATINGRLSASGAYVQQNASLGSGGSIWITGGTLTGTGTIAANAGTGGNTTAGGGGGRIDISGTTNNFTGSLQVLGGIPNNASAFGLAGSILLPQNAGTGLTMDNFVLTNAITFGNSLTFTHPVVVTNGGSLTLQANSNNTLYTFTTLTVATNSSVACQGNVALINPDAGGSPSNPYGEGVTLQAATLTIDDGGSLNANGTGFYAAGPGYTTNYGGAYGGKSPHAINPTYGALTNVTALGSGGYGGFGGGALKLVVSGTLTVNGTNACDGAISTVNQAAGSGGSLWIDCGTLQGAGVITAAGGKGNQNEGGGGGRIYIAYNALGAINPVAAGKVTAYGGTYNSTTFKGAAGTVMLRDRGAGQSYGTLLIDLDSIATNATTQLPTNTDAFAGTPPTLTVDEVVLRGFGVLELPSNKTLAVVSIFSNAASFLADTNSAVTLVGTNPAAVYGSSTFGELAINSAAKTVRFAAGTTNSVTRGLFVSDASLLSASAGQYWYLSVGPEATQDVRRVTAQDSNATNGQTIVVLDLRSTNLGHNVNWQFPDTSLPDVDAVAATNITDATADLIGSVLSTGASPTTVWAFWDTVNRGTNKTWTYWTSVVATQLGAVTNPISGLASNQLYYFTYYVSNTAGEVWAPTSLSFRTQGPPSVDNGLGATAIGPTNVTLRGTLLNGSAAYVGAVWGTNAASLTATSAPAWMAEGAFTVAVNGLLDNTTYFYQCFASNAYGATWAATVTNFNTQVLVGPDSDGSWIADADGAWRTAANWSDSIVANGAGRTARFTNDITGDRTVTIETAPRTVGVLTLGDANTTHRFTITATGGMTLTFTNSGTAQLNQTATSAGDIVDVPLVLADSLALANASPNTLTISGSVTNLSASARTLTNTGAGNVTLSGVLGNAAAPLSLSQNNAASVLTLSGANTFSGSMTISAGAVSVQSASALGSTSGTTTVSAGGALRLQGGVTVNAEPLVLNGTGVATDGALRNVQGTNTYSGQITLGSAARISSDAGRLVLDVATGSAITGAAHTVTFAGAGETQVADPIGCGGLTKVDSGTLILLAANTYTGVSTVAAGVVNTRTASALGGVTSGTVISNGAALQIQDTLTSAEPLTLIGAGVANDGALRSLSGANTNSGSITLGGAARINTDNGTLVLSGTFTGAGQDLTLGCATTTTVSGAIATGAGAVTKDGTGLLVLAGTNSFRGGLTVKAGALLAQTSANALGTNANVVTLGDGSGSQDVTLIGALAGTFGQPIVVAAGNTGMVTLTNTVACTFSNLVTLNTHDLRVTSSTNLLTLSGGIAGTGQVTLNTGAGGLTLSTAAINHTGAVVHANAGNGTTTVSAVIGSNVASVVQQSTNAALVLSGANTFTNGLLIRAGVVRGGNANSFGATSSVITLGDTSGALDATLFTTAQTTYGNPIAVISNNTGTATISDNNASTFSGAVTLYNHALTLSAPTARVTLSGGITGTGNLLINTAGAGYVNLSGSAVNMTGSITNSGTGTNATDFSAGVGSNVTTICQNSGTCPLTLTSVKLTVNSEGTTLVNNNAGGTAPLTVSGGVQGTGALLLHNNSSMAGGITLSGNSVNHAGAITNAGTGSGETVISAPIGINVTGIAQVSPTSRLVLGGASTCTGATLVAAGCTLRVTNTTGSATGTGAVTLNGTLEGGGTLSGTVTNSLGGMLAPGYDNPAFGTLTVGNLVWHGGGIYRCRIGNLDSSAAGAGSDYDYLVVSSALTAAPGGSNLVIRLDTLGQTLTIQTNQNYELKLVAFGSAPGLNLADITVDTNAFLVNGTWTLTNMNSALYFVALGDTSGKNYWIGSGTATNWSTPSNWSLGHVPQAGEDVAFDFRSGVNCAVDGATNTLASLTLAAGYTGTVTVLTKYPGYGTFTNLAISGDCAVNGGTLTHLANTGDSNATDRLSLSVGGNLTVGPDGAINVNLKGYAAARGPSAGGSANNSTGAGHGGLASMGIGQAQPGPTYGSVYAPTNLGSGAYGRGGGAILLMVTGTLTNNGAITALGSGAAYAGAAGGSILIQAAALAGDGTVDASGASGTTNLGSPSPDLGSGGGGRIAILLTTGTSFDNVACRAYGGPGGQYPAAAGTIYLQTSGQAAGMGSLVVDNNNGTAFNPVGACTLINEGNLNTLSSIVIRNRGILGINTNATIDFGAAHIQGAGVCAVTNWRTAAATPAPAAIAVRAMDHVTFPNPFVISNYSLCLDVPVTAIGDWTVADNGSLSHSGNYNPTPGAEDYRLRLTLAGNLTVQSGGAIEANTKGYVYWKGPSPAATLAGQNQRGASHGGRGGPTGGSPTPLDSYGSILLPRTLGSGGSRYLTTNVARPGGGSIDLIIQGTTTVNGIISTRPHEVTEYRCAGAAGGSIYLQTGYLQGSGSIDARGDIGNDNCSPGGGGRIAVILTASETFGTVSMSAAGVTGGATASGPGSVYLERASRSAGRGTVLFDNANITITSTNAVQLPVPAYADAGETRAATMVVSNRAQVTLTTNAMVGDLYLYTNSVIHLNGFTLQVNTYYHADWGDTNWVVYSNGQIIWAPPQGSIYKMR